jgi:NAD(P)-dependent dehydrogenase (short-subunit alcohol dehydrogenase family)
VRLAGKTIISGASSGIGAEVARLYATEGATLVLGARRKDRLDDLVREIGRDRVVALQGDARDEGFARGLVKLARTQFGAVDASLYNCGILGELGPVAEMTERTWREVLDTNLTGAFLAAKHQIATMRPAKRGSMVFTSSFVGNTIGLPGMGAYAASKAGLVVTLRMTRASQETAAPKPRDARRPGRNGRHSAS